MLRKKISIRFVGKDWDQLPLGQVPYPFDKVLPENYELVFDDKPDFVVSKESRDFYCSAILRFPEAPVRILFAGEAFTPDFNIFDYAIGFDHLEYTDRYFRMHTCNFFSFEFAYGSLDKSEKDIDRVLKMDRRFCNFIYSNGRSNPMRQEMFHLINEVGRVHAAGKLLNNYGAAIHKSDDWRASKIEFQGEYRFTISVENSRYPGYTTEKLLNPMFSLSIPIYWGNPRVGEYFNSDSFVNAHAYDSLEQVVDRVRELEQDPQLYEKVLRQPWMREDQKPAVEENRKAYEAWIKNIFDQDPRDARRRGEGTWVWAYEDTLRSRIQANTFVDKYLFRKKLRKLMDR